VREKLTPDTLAPLLGGHPDRRVLLLDHRSRFAAKVVSRIDQRNLEASMAKYGKGASKRVESAMRRRKKGTLKSGSGRKVKSRKQAIAIGLSEAREKGAKVPRKRTGRRKKAGKKR
jgi:hypothetical protein